MSASAIVVGNGIRCGPSFDARCSCVGTLLWYCNEGTEYCVSSTTQDSAQYDCLHSPLSPPNPPTLPPSQPPPSLPRPPSPPPPSRPPLPPRDREWKHRVTLEEERLFQHSISTTVQRVAGLSLAMLTVIIAAGAALVVGPLAALLLLRARRRRQSILIQQQLLSRDKARSSSRERMRVAPEAAAEDELDPTRLVSFGGLLSTCLIACLAACALPCMVARDRPRRPRLRPKSDQAGSSACDHYDGGEPQTAMPDGTLAVQVMIPPTGVAAEAEAAPERIEMTAMPTASPPASTEAPVAQSKGQAFGLATTITSPDAPMSWAVRAARRTRLPLAPAVECSPTRGATSTGLVLSAQR